MEGWWDLQPVSREFNSSCSTCGLSLHWLSYCCLSQPPLLPERMTCSLPKPVSHMSGLRHCADRWQPHAANSDTFHSPTLTAQHSHWPLVVMCAYTSRGQPAPPLAGLYSDILMIYKQKLGTKIILIFDSRRCFCLQPTPINTTPGHIIQRAMISSKGEFEWNDPQMVLTQ